MINNKKAISDLVATVLLVLIVIAAVGIIWGAIMPIIKSNIETSQKCSDAALSVNMESGYTYAYGNNVSVQVSRGPSTINVTSIQIKLIDNLGNSNITTVTIVPDANSDKVYSVNGTAVPKRIGIAPIVALGKVGYTCPMTEYDL